MPYKIEKQGDQWCVVDTDGKAHGCSDTEDLAKSHMAAMYANEDGAKTADPSSEAEAHETALLERLWEGIKGRLGMSYSPSDDTAFKVVTDANGIAHWFATWTNAYQDRDRQFFPESEIKAYIQRVDTGIVPLPELWVWHGGKQVRIGVAQQVDGHGRFGLAAGVFDDTPQGHKAREYYANPRHAKQTRLSHGFTYPTKNFDGTVFRQFNTFEISLLPKGVEANLYTSLEGVKAMVIDEKKRKYYEEVFGAEEFKHILDNLTEKDKALAELGAEYKDFTDVEQASAPVPDVSDSLSAALKELLPDLLEGQHEAVTASTEAVKAVSAFDKRLRKIEAFIAQTPKRASAAKETELDMEDEDDAAIVKQIELEQVNEKVAKFAPGLYDHSKVIPNSFGIKATPNGASARGQENG